MHDYNIFKENEVSVARVERVEYLTLISTY